MSNLPTKYQPQGVQPTSLEEMQNVAQMMLASGFFGSKREVAQAVVKIQAGQEMGLGIVQALTNLNVVQNRVTMGASLMASLIQRAGFRIVVKKHTIKECEIEVSDSIGVVGVVSFTMEDAQRAGLVKKDVWKKYPKNMLYARAISNAARWYAPGVMLGVYTPEELEDVPAPAEQPRHRRRPRPSPSAETQKKRKILDHMERVGDGAPHPAQARQSEVIDAQATEKPQPDINHLPPAQLELTPSPNPETAPKGKKSQAWIGANRALFGIGKDLGLSHEDLRDVVGVASISDEATYEQLRTGVECLERTKGWMARFDVAGSLESLRKNWMDFKAEHKRLPFPAVLYKALTAYKNDAKGRFEQAANEDGEKGECRSCSAPIVWKPHPASGKRHPYNPDGASHFSNCPDADKWRNSKGAA